MKKVLSFEEKISMFDALLALCNSHDREDLWEFVARYKAQEQKKKNTLTKSQRANLELKDMLLDLAFNGTATEVTASFNNNYNSNYSRNKIASLLTMLVKEDKIKREQVGKTAVFVNGGAKK